MKKTKEYKLPLLNKVYQERLDFVVLDGGDMSYYGPGQEARLRPAYNRITKNPVWKIVSESNNSFEMTRFAKHIANGEIIASQETFLWYLIDRYENRMEITLSQAAADEECIRWNFEELTCWLRALSMKYPHLISFWATNGQTCITFMRVYNNQ
jgi:hypothetical protein